MHFYFSGIAGSGIGPLAMICADADYVVSGSDMTQNDYTANLQRRGIGFSVVAGDEYIQVVHAHNPIDWLVISSAIPADHPEVRFAESAGIRIVKRAAVINYLLEDRNLKMLAVAGTHGKTTTTAMLVWLFKRFEVPVSYSIGANISFGSSGEYAEGSEYFAYECDEYDRNMLAFTPTVSLITNVDFDHPDIYSTKEDYDQAFRQFISQSKNQILWNDDATALNVIKNITTVLDKKDPFIQTLSIPGRHNRENAFGVFSLFCTLFPEIPRDAVVNELCLFPGTQRRFERLSENIYSDYAHHPTEIRATIDLARELGQHVVVVYQPHQNIRQHQVCDEYADCFSGADRVYWLPTFLSREDKSLSVLTPQDLIAQLENPFIAESAEMNNQLIEKLQEYIHRKYVVIGMGAGNIDAWLRSNFK